MAFRHTLSRVADSLAVDQRRTPAARSRADHYRSRALACTRAASVTRRHDTRELLDGLAKQWQDLVRYQVLLADPRQVEAQVKSAQSIAESKALIAAADEAMTSSD
jgi:hypothetical protein